MSCCFVSGAALLLLALLGVCQWIVTTVLSEHLKKAITVAIGVFQALIGFQVMGLVVASPNTLVTLGDVTWSNKQLYLALAGFCLISAMLVSRLHGALLVGIFLMSALAWVTGLAAAPEGVFSLPSYDAIFLIDFSGWDIGSGKLHAMVLGSLVLLFVALFDLAGVQYGLMGIAGLLEHGNVPRRWSQSIFSSAAVSTMCGAILGTSPVIIANESSAGIIEGARTGLSAVVVSGLFIASAFLTPVLSSIPRVATSVPLVLIGAFMMAPCRGIDWDNLRAAIPSFLTITVVPFTYSIHNGIIAGILMDAFLMISAGKDEAEVRPANSPRQPLLNQDTRTQSPLERLLCTPHATMAYQSDKAHEEVDHAQLLLDRLRQKGGSSTCQQDHVEDGLLCALEAYLASQSDLTQLDQLFSRNDFVGQVSVFQQLASQLLPEDGKEETKCTIPVRRPDGTATQVRLEIRRDAQEKPKDGQSIQDYLEHHKVQQRIQSLIQEIPPYFLGHQKASWVSLYAVVNCQNLNKEVSD
eukprot:symbB.v1.2.028154.t1/scaffold2955.1/size66548/2